MVIIPQFSLPESSPSQLWDCDMELLRICTCIVSDMCQDYNVPDMYRGWSTWRVYFQLVVKHNPKSTGQSHVESEFDKFGMCRCWTINCVVSIVVWWNTLPMTPVVLESEGDRLVMTVEQTEVCQVFENMWWSRPTCGPSMTETSFPTHPKCSVVPRHQQYVLTSFFSK